MGEMEVLDYSAMISAMLRKSSRTCEPAYCKDMLHHGWVELFIGVEGDDEVWSRVCRMPQSE